MRVGGAEVGEGEESAGDAGKERADAVSQQLAPRDLTPPLISLTLA
jgi:hypothetical protein